MCRACRPAATLQSDLCRFPGTLAGIFRGLLRNVRPEDLALLKGRRSIRRNPEMFCETITSLPRNCNRLPPMLGVEGDGMRKSTVQFAWRDPRSTEGFHSGVCLHGHTMHSQECLSFLPRYLRRVPGISQVLSYYERGPRRVDFGRAWWTPPLTPASALSLEREQIARLGLCPMVSLTDHDDIEAGLTLGVIADPCETPVSVEWTVPYERSFFHVGVHNIPRNAARCWMDAMAEYTSGPHENMLPAILDEFASNPDVLIVLNHPFWLEEG